MNEKGTPVRLIVDLQLRSFVLPSTFDLFVRDVTYFVRCRRPRPSGFVHLL